MKNTYLKTINLAANAVTFALVQFGGGVSQIRGSIDGTVFSRNRAGAIARGRTKPINPVTQRQSEVRAAFGQASSAWGSLNSADVTDWDAYASQITRLNGLGESYTPKGRQVFMEINQNLQLVGLPAVTKPPVITDTPSMSSLGAVTATLFGGDLSLLNIADAAVTIPSGSVGKLIIEASPTHDAKKTNVNNLFRQVAVLDADDAPIILLGGYAAVFGLATAAGQLVDIRVRVVDNGSGLGSSWLLAQGTVAL